MEAGRSAPLRPVPVAAGNEDESHRRLVGRGEEAGGIHHRHGTGTEESGFEEVSTSGHLVVLVSISVGRAGVPVLRRFLYFRYMMESDGKSETKTALKLPPLFT